MASLTTTAAACSQFVYVTKRRLCSSATNCADQWLLMVVCLFVCLWCLWCLLRVQQMFDKKMARNLVLGVNYAGIILLKPGDLKKTFTMVGLLPLLLLRLLLSSHVPCVLPPARPLPHVPSRPRS